MTPLALEGRVALVTGGTRGIGAGISRALHAAGSALAVGYRSRREEAAALEQELGERVLVVQADIGDTGAADLLVRRTLETYGRLDTLVLNAGIWRGGPIETLADDDWSSVIDTSLNSAFRLVRAGLGPLREAGNGRVVVISSAIGLMGFPGDTAYAAAKAGLVGFVRALAKEVGRHGITVNAVAPGLVDTEMTAGIPDSSREQMLRRASLRRTGQVDEIASAVRYLVADGAYVTGHTLVVDGGLTL